MSDFDDLLKFDPLAEAEKVTGKSYKEDDATMALGFFAHIAKDRQVRDEMTLRDDTHYNTTFRDAGRIVEDLGFILIHEHDFPGTSYTGDTQPVPTEVFRVYWREDGILLDLNSHRGIDGAMNGLHIYYNWVPNDWDAHPRPTSSGGVHTPYALTDERGDDKTCWTWVGHHDGRTGLRHILGQLAGAGRFLPSWVSMPHLWLVDYSQEHASPKDWRESSAYYKKINADMVASLPAQVRTAMAVTP